MTTTPPDAPHGPSDGPPQEEQHPGPRVSREQVRDVARLRRSSYDRKIAGVAGGLARHLDVDPIIVRVALVVLVFFGGSGLLLYGACWLLVPDDVDGRATVRLDDRSRSLALLAVGGLAALALLGDTLGGLGFPWPLAVVGLLVLLVLSSRQQRGAAPYPTYPAQPYAGQPDAAPGARYGDAPTAAPVPPYAPPVPRRPRRPGPLLFWFTLALSALGVGVLGILDLAGAGVAGAAYPALVLATTGAMLVVGAFYGRAGGLALVGLVAAMATAGATAAAEVEGGRVVETPATSSEVRADYDFFAGDVRLDLSEVADPAGLDGRTLDVEIAFGRLELLVPEGLRVEVRSTVEGAGSSDLFGEVTDGSATRTLDAGPGAPVLVVDAQVTFGEVVVATDERDAR